MTEMMEINRDLLLREMKEGDLILNAKEIGKRFGLARTTAYDIIDPLVRQKILKKISYKSGGRGRPKTAYCINYERQDEWFDEIQKYFLNKYFGKVRFKKNFDVLVMDFVNNNYEIHFYLDPETSIKKIYLSGYNKEYFFEERLGPYPYTAIKKELDLIHNYDIVESLLIYRKQKILKFYFDEISLYDCNQ